VPGSQQIKPLSWPSHKDTALKALTKLASPHIAPTLKALEKAIVKAEREHKEALTALLESKKSDAQEDPDAEGELDSPATLPGLLSDEEEEQLDTDDPPVPDVIEAPLAPPVDASTFEQPNEGPAPMPDLPDDTDPEPDGEAVPGAEDVLDASAEIDF
jgi:hypothetical protein